MSSILNRRAFVKKSAVTGLTLSMTPAVLTGKDDRKVRIGFIGVGGQGTNLLKHTLKLGDGLKVAVLFKGEPLSYSELAWSYPGKGETFAGSIKTDQNGEAIVPLIKAGAYVIRLTHMEWVKKQTHEWESYWASLTFEVLEK